MRVPLARELFETYLRAPEREKYRISSMNPVKQEAVRRILESRRDERIIIIGQYLEQLKQVSDMLGSPLITGKLQTQSE